MDTALIEKYKQTLAVPKKARKLNPRQELIEQITCELNIDPKYRRGIYFTLLTNAELKEEWQIARAWKKNPAALFNKRVRQKNREIRDNLKLNKAI